MSIRIGSYQELEADLRAVRDAVFIVEQQIDRELEFDDRDLFCQHVVVFEANAPVATGRIDVSKGGKVGRVAVLPDARRRGFGAQVMHALEDVASSHQLAKLWFHAQISAVAFYESLGYQIVGDEFLEANIPHVMMEKRIA